MFVPWVHLPCDGALPFERSGRVQMTDRDGQGVGGVECFRGFRKFEQTHYHMLDLLLLGASVTDDGGFNGEGRVFGDLEPGGGSGQHGDPPHLPQLQGRLHVEGVEDVFDRDLVGLMLGDDCPEMHVDTREASGQLFPRR